MVKKIPEYKFLHLGGRVNISASISSYAFQLLDDENIPNKSDFVNELIIEALTDKEREKKLIFGQINHLISLLNSKYEESFIIQREFSGKDYYKFNEMAKKTEKPIK